MTEKHEEGNLVVKATDLEITKKGESDE